MATKTKRPVRRAGKQAPKAATRKQPEGLRLTLVRPGLTVNDLDASIRFYQAVGFSLETEFKREGIRTGVRLKAGDVTLSLSQDDWAKGRDRKKGEAFRFYMSTAQDVDVIAARIKAGGYTLDQAPEDMVNYGVRAFSVTDPSGFHLTISRPLA
jgi:predicted enzyme related to lactoylglutathione lyase